MSVVQEMDFPEKIRAQKYIRKVLLHRIFGFSSCFYKLCVMKLNSLMYRKTEKINK
jgi:hypothetical protein